MNLEEMRKNGLNSYYLIVRDAYTGKSKCQTVTAGVDELAKVFDKARRVF